MPSNLVTQNLRIPPGFLDKVRDEGVGGGSSSVPLARGQLGAKFALGSDEVKLSSTFNNLTGFDVRGVFQYVKTLSTDTVPPSQGLLAFWSDRDPYIVSTADTNAMNRCGIFLGGALPGEHVIIQCVDDGGIGIVNGGANTFAANELVFPAADGTATANRVAVSGASAAQVSNSIGIALGTKVSGLVAVQFRGSGLQ